MRRVGEGWRGLDEAGARGEVEDDRGCKVQVGVWGRWGSMGRGGKEGREGEGR